MGSILLSFLIFDALFSTRPLIELQNTLGPQWETLVHGLSLLGDSRLILIIAVALFWFTSRHRPYQVLAASLAGAAIGSVIKLLIGMPRPADPELLLYTTTTSPSFPSGHVVLATCFWGILALYGWIPRWLAAGIVLIVAFTRVYLGAHFIGDVLAGAAIGLIWLVLFYRYIGPWLESVRLERLAAVVAIVLGASFVVLPVTSAFPFGWEIVGGLAGAGLGLVIQQRRIRFEPAPVGALWQTLKLPIGILGIAVFIIADWLIGPEIMLLEITMYFLAAFWALLIAPAIFRSLGLGEAPTTT
jgi:glycerophosphoryl diester phosphodiesterase